MRSEFDIFVTKDTSLDSPKPKPGIYSVYNPAGARITCAGLESYSLHNVMYVDTSGYVSLQRNTTISQLLNQLLVMPYIAEDRFPYLISQHFITQADTEILLAETELICEDWEE